jgi:dCTP deaminase
MIVGKKFIELCLKRGWIYCNPEPRNVTEVSLDVTLGKGAWILTRHGDIKMSINPENDSEFQFKWIDDLTNYILYPNTLLIAHTHEFVGSRVSWLTPQIRSRSTIARWGFEIGTAALFGEPGFYSRWALELHNTAGVPIALQPGWRVGQVIFQLTLGNALYNRKYNAPERDWVPETLLPKRMN